MILEIKPLPWRRRLTVGIPLAIGAALIAAPIAFFLHYWFGS